MIYDIVGAMNISDLTAEVNYKLQLGWQLQGGIACSEYWYFQAMTLEGKEKTYDPNYPD